MTDRAVLIIGGTGVFGKRLVRHLASFAGITLFVSSRSAEKSKRFVQTINNSTAELHSVALDCRENLSEVLKHIQPFLVIDCSGPFQGASYETAKTVMSSGAHLIDLADARGYLAQYSETLDATARRHNVTALTGASSTPTLSSSVVDHVTQGWQRIDTIDICITPGGQSEVGRSVIEAILSYAGKPVPIWRAGRLSQTTGWQHTGNVHIPGLGHRRVAAVETLDAQYLGPRLDVTSRVCFSAGLESKLEQWGIEVIAALRKRRLIGGLNALIPALLAARKLTRLSTSDSGGMQVSVAGLDATGTPVQATWTLIARQDHGPNVPILPAAAAARAILDNRVLPGANLAIIAVDLDDILAQSKGYEITTNTHYS